jgi:acyl-CoA oxidase
MEDGSINPRQVALLREQKRDTLVQLLPEAVRLMDAFDFPDYVIDTASERQDG